MEMNVTKILRVITQVIPADCCGNDGFATATCKRTSKKLLQGIGNNCIKTEGQDLDKCIKDRENITKKVYNICIKPRNCNKQICTTKSSTTQDTAATNLNCKCLILPNNKNNSSSNSSSCNHDYSQTKYYKNNINNSNRKSHNSIISILHCKQFKARQQQQPHEQQEQQLKQQHLQPDYKTPHYRMLEKSTPPLKSLSFSSKHLHLLKDLFYLLLLSLHLLPLAAGSCRYEPSRSCEAICRPIWSPPDNNNYQSTVLDTNNVTLENFFAADYNCTIRALVLMPDDDMYVASLKRVVPILQVAEHHIHASGLLPSYIQFDWMPQDDKCDAAFAAVKAMDGIVKNCSHVFFGPVCDYSLGK